MPYEVESGGNPRGVGGYNKNALFPGGFIGSREDISRALESGYDGIIRSDEIIAFRPEQIKSATGNVGTFGDTADIRFSRRGGDPMAGGMEPAEQGRIFKAVSDRLNTFRYYAQDKHIYLRRLQEEEKVQTWRPYLSPEEYAEALDLDARFDDGLNPSDLARHEALQNKAWETWTNEVSALDAEVNALMDGMPDAEQELVIRYANMSVAEVSDAEVRALVEQYASVEGSPTDAEIAEAVRQFRETERAYGGREAYEKAKADGKTKLNYRQWVQVRTPNFKAWFGDWEAQLSSKDGGEGVKYDHAEEELTSRLVQWLTAAGLDGRRTGGVVGKQWAQPSYDAGSLRQAKPYYEGSSRAEIRADQDRLIARAKKNGFSWNKATAAKFESQLENAKHKGGSEHDAYIVGKSPNKIVIRNTLTDDQPGFGPTGDATASQYLKRLDDFNRVFPELQIRVIGVSQAADGKAVIWTAQAFVEGREYTSATDLQKAMEAHGWAKGRRGEYTHAETGAVINDVHPGNVLYIGDELFPIDVIVEHIPEVFQTPAVFNQDAVSKVIDPDTGEPMVVYHGTGAKQRRRILE